METIIFNMEGVEGMTLYVVYWRRPEEEKFTRVRFFTTTKYRDRYNAELIAQGLVTRPTTWQIPPAK